jgi:hypothetical protein
VFNVALIVVFILGLFITLVINRWWSIRTARTSLECATRVLQNQSLHDIPALYVHKIYVDAPSSGHCTYCTLEAICICADCILQSVHWSLCGGLELALSLVNKRMHKSCSYRSRQRKLLSSGDAALCLTVLPSQVVE